ncbi:MAG: hypothetical protein ACYTF6_09505 [Planctomycetota bacterium]
MCDAKFEELEARLLLEAAAQDRTVEPFDVSPAVGGFSAWSECWALLDAFIRPVNHWHDRARLTQEQADELIHYAEWIRMDMPNSDG